jgi:hypothetical protein
MSNNNNNIVDPPEPPNLETAVISPAAADKAGSSSGKHRGWTTEFDLALLEEIGNCGAHTPGYNHKVLGSCYCSFERSRCVI